ncbi:MAG: alpha-N-acetylglucosaminidase TIM-barrel domain-containing protein [Rikenellaceae bacterium]
MRGLLIFLVLVVLCSNSAQAANPVSELLERKERGASRHFRFEISDPNSADDFFEIESQGSKIYIGGNSWINIARGLNYYLAEYAGVYIGFDTKSIKLPKLPKVNQKITRSTDVLWRYSASIEANSYSTPFWSKNDWQRYIDYLALRGVNAELVTTGVSEVWSRALLKAGYSREEIQKFIPNSAFEGLWLAESNPSEGITPPEYTLSRSQLGAEIVEMCKKWGMDVMLYGYNSNLIENAPEELEGLYYKYLTEIYGTTKLYYIPTPKEKERATKILSAIESTSNGAQWVVPTTAKDTPSAVLLDELPRSSVIVLDSWAEVAPQWGTLNSQWLRKDSFLGHQWVYGIKNNFTPSMGVYGAIGRMVDNYYVAKSSDAGYFMIGVGSTSNVLGEDEVITDLLYSLPWYSKEELNKKEWFTEYLKLRYSSDAVEIAEAAEKLYSTLYSAPRDTMQRGSSESVFAATPALVVNNVSPRGTTTPYYDTQEMVNALELLSGARTAYLNAYFKKDMVRLGFRALSDYANELLVEIQRAFDLGDKEKFTQKSNIFLRTIILADNLLNSHSGSLVGVWINSAMTQGKDTWQREWLRASAKIMVEQEALVMAGVLSDVYATRWSDFFDYITRNERLPLLEDYSTVNKDWLESKTSYPIAPPTVTKECIDEILELIIGDF